MRYFFSVALLAFSLTQAKAQVSKNLRDSTVVVIFNGSGSIGSKHQTKKTGEDNIIKIAPLGFISGTFPVFFEKKINDFFSVQLGAGLTGFNYFRNTINNAENSLVLSYPWGNNSSNTDVVEPVFSYNERKAGMGYMFSIQPRLYFESEALEGSYMAISYDNYHYTSNIPGITSDGSGNPVYDGPTKDEHENIGDIMVHFGYQTIYDRLTMEYSTGIGLRNVNGTKYAGYIDYNTNAVVDGFATYKQTIFNYSIGLRVGYHF